MPTVIKATGEKEPFSQEKIIYSIKRAGIPLALEDKVLDHVKSKLYENIPTSEIYKHITEFLETKSKPIKAKYGLKRAIMDLGPTGYPFEDYVSEILKGEGYITQVRSVLSGKCVSHEVDVVAEKEGTEKIMVEAKFHNEAGIRSDIHVALYTKARFDDLKQRYNFDRAWLFTNTKVTIDALTYAICVNMGIVSWNYPEKQSLRDLIEKEKLYPISLIEALSKQQLQILLENHIVLAKDICKNNATLDVLEIQPDKKRAILQQALQICS